MHAVPEVDIADALKLLGGGGLGGLFTWLAARRRGKSDDRSAEQALIKIAQDAAAQTMTDLRADIAALRADAVEDRQRIADLERALDAEKQARKDERHALNNELAAAKAEAMLTTRRAEKAESACEEAAGLIRQLEQRNDSLIRRLKAGGVEVPDAPTRAVEPALLGDPAA